jgi:hypothetical protein
MAEQAYATMSIVNPLLLDRPGVFEFNSTDYPVNSTFTAEFYITSIIGMDAWQIRLQWNNSIIHYDKAWVPGVSPYPGTSVFSEAIDNGATPIFAVSPPDIDNNTQTADFLVAMTTLELTPVNVVGQGLLFKMNFTIAADPKEGQTLSTNLDLIKKRPIDTYIQSFVMIYPSGESTEILAEAATVRVFGPNAVSQRTVDVAVKKIEFSAPVAYLGENVSITVTFSNAGTDLQKFNFTLKSNEVQFATGQITLLPNASDYYIYIWNVTSDFKEGSYSIEARVQPLPDEKNVDNNVLAGTIAVMKRLEGIEYAGWLLSLWFSTPLGIEITAYVIIAMVIYIIIVSRERLKIRGQNVS